MRKLIRVRALALIILFYVFWSSLGIMVKSVSATSEQVEKVTLQLRIIDEQAAYLNGEDINFEISVRNNTDTTINELVVKERFQAGSFTPLTGSAILIAGAEQQHVELPIPTDDEALALLQWTITELPAGENWTLRYRATVHFANEQPALKTANVFVEEELIDDATISLEKLDLNVEVESAGIIGPDGQAKFRITLTNHSSVAIPDVQIQHDLYGSFRLPTFSSVKPASDDINDFENMPVNNGDFLIWNIDEIGTGAKEKWEISFDAIIDPYFDEGNEYVTHWVSVLVGGNLVDQTNVLSLERGEAALDLVYMAPQKVNEVGQPISGDIRPGDQVKYTLHLTNTGNYAAQHVEIIDRYNHSAFSNVDAISANGQFDGTFIRWEFEEIPADGSETLTYILTVQQDLAQLMQGSSANFTIKNEATLLENNQEPMVISSANLDVRVPILRIGEVKTSASIISGGDGFDLIIEVENKGNSVAEGVEIIAAYSPAIGTVTPGDGGVVMEDKGVVVWSIKELDVNQTKYVSYHFEAFNQVEENIEHFQIEVHDADGIMMDEYSLQITFQPTFRPIQSEYIFGLLIALLIVGTLVVVGFQSQKLAQKQNWLPGQYLFYRDIIEIVTVIVIVSAVLLLGFTQNLKESQALTVLSGIAGYVLGRHGLGTEQSSFATAPANNNFNESSGRNVNQRSQAESAEPTTGKDE